MKPKILKLGTGLMLGLALGFLAAFYSGEIQIFMVRHLVQSHPQLVVEVPAPEQARSWAWGFWVAAFVFLPFLVERKNRFREAFLPMLLNLLFAAGYFGLQRWMQDVKVDAALLAKEETRITFHFAGFNTHTYPVKWLLLLIVTSLFFHYTRPQPAPCRKTR